jgi:hypothetical protein
LDQQLDQLEAGALAHVVDVGLVGQTQHQDLAVLLDRARLR